MKIIKNINNNFALATDKKGNTLIVRGKGIGFGAVPREADKKLIERSYYDVEEQYISMISSLPDEVIMIATQIVDRARMVLNNPISSNIVFTLADHISFALERYKKNMNIKLPLVYDVKHLYEKEYELGLYGLKLIKEKLRQFLPKEEASYIALHLLNAEEHIKEKTLEDEEVIDQIVRITEKEFGIQIDKEGFSYSRFVSHMYYLLKRGKENDLIKTENTEIYNKIRTDYQQTYLCVEKISAYFVSKLNTKLTDEEKLYLMLHINRLCTREDCDQ